MPNWRVGVFALVCLVAPLLACRALKPKDDGPDFATLSFEQLPAAPSFQIAGWAEAAPVFDDSRPRLVVAWTTWCPSCGAETPTLNALQKKYAGKVDLVALSDESTGELAGQVPKIDVSVRRTFPAAADSDVDTTHVYGRAVGEGEVRLPKAWLVHRGRIVWHGHPADAQPALDETLTTGDAAASRRTGGSLEALGAAYKAASARGDEAGAKAEGQKLLTAAQGRGYFAVMFAVKLLRGSKADVAYALQLAKLANDASFNVDYTHLSILSLVQWENRLHAEARETIGRALALCRALRADCEDVESQLAEFSDGTK